MLLNHGVFSKVFKAFLASLIYKLFFMIIQNGSFSLVSTSPLILLVIFVLGIVIVVPEITKLLHW